MQSFPVRVLLCWPIDPDEIARLNELAPSPEQHFAPTDDHLRDLCDSCRTPVYVHKDQYEQFPSSLVRNEHRKLCFACAHAIQKAFGGLRV